MNLRAGALFLLLSACDGTEKPGDTSGDTDADTDADSDTDSDTDVDTDTDTDVPDDDQDDDGYTTADGDCDDADPWRNPGATEVCNEVDDDCDGAVDDAAVPVDWFYDADADGHGNATNVFSSCEPVEGYVRAGDDCDDTNPAINPSAAEVCGGVDDDCDGLVDGADADVTGEPTWYHDGDADGFGEAASSVQACEGPIGYVADGTDCDDDDAAVNPAATERCDGVDGDCDGLADDDDATDRTSWYTDADADGYGGGSATLACSAPAGAVALDGDCDDSDDARNPGEAEVCGDGVDNDCDGGAGSCRASGTLDVEDEAILTIYGDTSNGRLGYELATDDFDADGVADLALWSQEAQVTFFSGGLAGEYVESDATVILTAESYGAPITAPGDMTGDGVPDFIASDSTEDVDNDEDGCVYLIAGPITASMDMEDGEARYIGEAGDRIGWNLATPGDVTGDGLADIYSSTVGGFPSSLGIYLLPGGASGDFSVTSAPTEYRSSSADYFAFYGGIHAADLDGDGVSDLLATSDTYATVFLGPPPSGVVPVSAADGRITGNYTFAMGTGDLSGDGTDDVVMVTYDGVVRAFYTPPTGGDVAASTASWTATLSEIDSSGERDIVADADFDGDGSNDLFVPQYRDSICGWYGPIGTGSTSCAAADLTYSQEYIGSAAMVPVDDVNGDGLPELLMNAYCNSEEEYCGGAAFLLSPAGL